MWSSLSHLRGGKRLASFFLQQPRQQQLSSLSSSSQQPLSLKKLIQPFVMKCHPDMAKQQGLPESARKVNLEAIQSLNSYVDGVNKLMKHNNIKYPFPSEGHTVEIEFVIPMGDGSNHQSSSEMTTKNPMIATKKNNRFVISTSRRKLELLAPPMDMPPAGVRNYAVRQFLRLLRISDLPVPASVALYGHEENVEYDQDETSSCRHGGYQDNQEHQGQTQKRRKPVSAWEASRERFWKRYQQNMDHQKFDRMYKEALHDAQVHIRTRNWIRDNPKLRHKLLANVLSNIKFVESISPLERLVAYRRLLRFLDEHFDELRLEDSGKYWEEQATLMVGEPRPYNTSPSALRKLRKKQMKALYQQQPQQQHFETGYSFAIHHDDKVTVTIPIDFDNHELLQELLRNMEDFLQTQGTGLEGDYYSAMYGQEDSIL